MARKASGEDLSDDATFQKVVGYFLKTPHKPHTPAATSKRAKQAGESAKSLTDHPYVRRLLEDEELRDTIRAALDYPCRSRSECPAMSHPLREN